MDVRAVAYTPGGERIGVLPDVLEMTLTVPVAATPTVALTYPAGGLGVRGPLLDSELEVAVEVTHDGTTWSEPDGARFLSLRTEENPLGDGTESRSLQAIHISNRLSEARVWDVPPAAADADGKWNFLSQNSGTILRTLWDAATRRGWGQGLSLDVTTTTDSTKRPWDKVVTLAYAPSVDLATVATSLVDLGLIDISWSGRTMRVYNANGHLARRREHILWPLSAGTTAAPEATTWADLCTDVLVIGEGGRTWRIHNENAPVGLRRIEKVVEAGGVELEATAHLVAQSTLASGATPALEAKREWHADHALLLPWRDYVPGDWITVERASGREVLRVSQVSVTRDNNGVSGHTTFGTRLDDALSRVAKRTKGVTGGAATSGAGVRPAPQGQDRRIPAKVLGLVATGEAVPVTDGTVKALVRASWAAVSTATDATAMEIASYEIALRPNTMGAPWVLPASSQSTSLDLLWGQPGETIQVKVRARGTYATTPGVWSDPVTLTLPLPTILQPPTALAAECSIGMVTLTWDGQLVHANGPRPSESWLHHLRVEEKDNETGRWVAVGEIASSVDSVLLDRQEDVGQELTWRAIAVDVVGRASQPGATTSLTVRSHITEQLQAAQDKAAQAARDGAAAKAQVQAQAERMGTLEGTVQGLAARVEASEAAAQDAERVASQAQTAAGEATRAASAATQAAREHAARAQAAAQEYAAAQAAAAQAAATAAASQDATAKAEAARLAAEATAKKAAADAAARAQQAAEAKADAAKRAAEASQVAADAAKQQAAQAKTTAEAAKQQASGADTKAEKAQAAATAATSIATSTQAKANEANAKALAAQAAADAAKAQAAKAVSDAEADAQRKADAAREAAKTYAKAQADAAKAAAVAAASGDAKAQADAAKAAAMAAAALDAKKKADGAQRAAEAKAAEAKRAAQAAQSRADQAAADAVRARQAADQATAKALGAQATADAANVKASTADGRYTITSSDPAIANGTGKPTGSVWEVRSGSTSLRRFVWDGKAWTKIQAGQDFIGAKAIGQAQIAAAAVGTLQVADAAITNAKLGWVSAEKLRAAVGHLDVGFVRSLLSDTGFIRHLFSERISVAAGSLFPDALFQDRGSWNLDSGVGSWGTDVAVSGGVLVLKAMRAQRGVYYQPPGHQDASMVLKPGRSYRVSLMVQFVSPAGSGNLASVYLRHHDSAGAVKALRVLAVTTAAGGNPTTWRRVEGQFTLPASDRTGACSLGLFVEPSMTAGEFRAAEVRVEEAVGSTLIEPGSITTPLLAAGAVTTAVLAAGAVDAGKIKVGALDGQVITGATVQTAKSGARIVMNSHGLSAYSAKGAKTFNINAATGEVTATGYFSISDEWSATAFRDIGTADNVVDIDPGKWGNSNWGTGLVFYATNSAWDRTAFITARQHSSGQPALVIAGPLKKVGTGQQSYISMMESVLQLYGGSWDAKADPIMRPSVLLSPNVASITCQRSMLTLSSHSINGMLGYNVSGVFEISAQSVKLVTGDWPTVTGFFANATNTVMTWSRNVQLILGAGGMSVRGTKNFIMAVPGHTERRGGMLLRHAATESPLDGIEYWQTVTLDASGHGTWGLPEYLPAIAAPGAPWGCWAQAQDGTPVRACLVQPGWGDGSESWRVDLAGQPGAVVSVLVKGARIIDRPEGTWEDRSGRGLWVMPPATNDDVAASAALGGDLIGPAPAPQHRERGQAA